MKHISIQRITIALFVVLCFVVGFNSAKADSSTGLQINGGMTVDTGNLPIRNDVLEAAPSNGEMPKVGSSALLHMSLDKLIGATIEQNISPSDTAKFCLQLDEAFIALTPDERATFAWRTTSYEGNRELKAEGVTGAQADLYVSSQEMLSNINERMQSLAPRAGDQNKAVSDRTKAIVRSAMLDMMAELRKKEGMDAIRVQELTDLSEGALRCLDEKGLDDQTRKDDSAKVIDEVLAFRKDWNANPESLGGTADTAEAVPLSIRVSSNDTVSDDVMINDPDSVKSDSDLEVYAKTLVSKDANIKSIMVNENDTALSYKEPAKLFGFIPIKMSATVHVGTDGTVTVKWPWTSFMVKKKVKVDQAEVSSTLSSQGLISASTDGDAAVNSSVTTRAQVLSTLSGFFKNMNAASVNTATEADTSLTTDEGGAEVEGDASVQ